MMAARHMRPKDESVFLNLITSLCGKGSLDEALEVLRVIKMFRLEVNSSHYDVLLENFGKTVEMLDEMLKRGTLSATNNYVLGSSTYNPVIILMLLNDCVPELDRLLVALCDKDKTIAALKLADFVLERDCDICFSSYDRVLETLYSVGKTLNAYSLLCEIKKKVGITNNIASAAMFDEGKKKQADILRNQFLCLPQEMKLNKLKFDLNVARSSN